LRNQSTGDSRFLRIQLTDSGFTESKWPCTEFPVGSFLIFVFEIADSTLTDSTDSTDSRIPPKTERHFPAPQPPRTGPLPRARGMPLGLEPHHAPRRGTGRRQSVTAGPYIGGQRAKIIARTAAFSIITGAFAHIELQERYPLVLSPDSM
jgi:hypothetical protein